MQTQTLPSLSLWIGLAPLLTITIAIVALIPEEWPRWGFMWILAFGIFCGCKWLTWYGNPGDQVPAWKRWGYLLAWPGMDAFAFWTASTRKPTRAEWAFAAIKFLLGVGLFWGIGTILPTLLPEINAYWIGWGGMIGIVFILHFGIAHLLSCLWRSWDVQAKPLMNAPFLATSLGEFWGRRWNVAFRDLTYRFLFRPLLERFGGWGSTAIGFLISGLIHDLVISVPAGRGYGLPTLYFVIQGLGIFIERSRLGKKLRLGRSWSGWLFTMIVLISPAGLLFHEPFVLNVVVPFMEFCGAY